MCKNTEPIEIPLDKTQTATTNNVSCFYIINLLSVRALNCAYVTLCTIVCIMIEKLDARTADMRSFLYQIH